MFRPAWTCVWVLVWLGIASGDWQSALGAWQAGAAKVDITPTNPIMLSGYAARGQEEVEQTIQPLYARALCLQWQDEPPLVLITVDNCGIPAVLSDQVSRTLEEKFQVPRKRIAICATHTHYAPMLSGVLENLPAEPIDPEKRATIERYTRELAEHLVQVASEAIESKQEASIRFGIGSAGFAANRRTPGGPTDHQLPVLQVVDPEDRPLAIVTGYACHCTTIGQTPAFIGDWAGYAAQYLERQYLGCTALVLIGCGGDQNPSPRGSLELAQKYGLELMEQTRATLSGPLQPVTGPVSAQLSVEPLPFAPLPTEDQWRQQALREGIQGHYARRNLRRLEEDEGLRSGLPYPVQTWALGDRLALVILGGEVVVDYSLRLKQEARPGSLWVVAYANDVASYIPSERVLKEGGYEGGESRIWYDQPAPFAPGLEQLIIQRVWSQLPREFRRQP